MTDDSVGQAIEELVKHLLTVDGHSDSSLRRAVFANDGVGEPALGALAEKVALRPTTISDRDIAAVRDAGLTEDQIFELVVCAAVGQASRQYESGLNALVAAEAGEA